MGLGRNMEFVCEEECEATGGQTVSLGQCTEVVCYLWCGIPTFQHSPCFHLQTLSQRAHGGANDLEPVAVQV